MGVTIVSIKIVRDIFNDQISDATASRYINYVRDILNKQKPKKITIEEFKKVHGLEN